MNTYKKEYLKGSSPVKEFSNGGHAINISILEEDFLKIPIATSAKGIKYRNFSLGSKPKVDDYGNSYNMYFTIKEGEEPSQSGPDSKDEKWDW